MRKEHYKVQEASFADLSTVYALMVESRLLMDEYMILCASYNNIVACSWKDNKWKQRYCLRLIVRKIDTVMFHHWKDTGMARKRKSLKPDTNTKKLLEKQWNGLQTFFDAVLIEESS